MRMHFWLDVARVKGRRSLPVNTSLNGTMPAFVNMSVGSFCGMSGADAHTSCPLPAKKERNDERTWELRRPGFELMASTFLALSRPPYSGADEVQLDLPPAGPRQAG